MLSIYMSVEILDLTNECYLEFAVNVLDLMLLINPLLSLNSNPGQAVYL